MKNISFSLLYLKKISSICEKGIKLSYLDAIKIPGHPMLLIGSGSSTSSTSKLAFSRMIGFMYL